MSACWAVDELHAFGAYCGGDNGRPVSERVHILGDDAGAIADGSGEKRVERRTRVRSGTLPSQMTSVVLVEGGIGAVTGDIELDLRSNFVNKGQTSASSHWSASRLARFSKLPRNSTPSRSLKTTARRTCFGDQRECSVCKFGWSEGNGRSASEIYRRGPLGRKFPFRVARNRFRARGREEGGEQPGTALTFTMPVVGENEDSSSGRPQANIVEIVLGNRDARPEPVEEDGYVELFAF